MLWSKEFVAIKMSALLCIVFDLNGIVAGDVGAVAAVTDADDGNNNDDDDLGGGQLHWTHFHLIEL